MRPGIIGIALLAVLAGSGCYVPPAEPINTIHTIDTAKLTAVEVNLKQDPILAGCVLKVWAQGDMCVLDGKVPKPESKAKAEELARRVEGITKVANHLIVVPEEEAQPADSVSF